MSETVAPVGDSVRAPGWTLSAVLLWGLAGLLGCVPAMFSPMMLDAPGSEESPWTVFLVTSLAMFPVVSWASTVGLVWVRRRARRGTYPRIAAIMFGLVPLVGVAAVIAGFTGLSVFCGGEFRCGG